MAASGATRQPLSPWRRGRAAVGLTLAAWSVLALVSEPALRLLVPLQRAVYCALMPGFDVDQFVLTRGPVQLSLAALARSREPIPLPQGIAAPGLTLRAQTPARSALLPCALACVGWAWRQSGACRLTSGLARLLAAQVLLLALSTPIVLAGHQWSLLLDARPGLSGPLLVMAASEVLLHGGLLMVGIVSAVVLSGMVLSDYAPLDDRGIA